MILTNSGVLKLMQRIKSFIASQLNTKANSVHTHTLSEIDDLSSLQMGGYSKSEVDTLLNGKSDTGHTHTKSEITDFPTLSTVATSGSYNDLSNKPTIPTTTSKLTNDSGFITADYAVPRSGGAVISGGDLARTADNGELNICGGTAWNNSGAVLLFGGGRGDYLTGAVVIRTFRDVTTRNMHIYPNGTWTWEGQPVQTASDQRLKQQITEIDDKLLDAWQDVDLVQFKYNDAVDQKKDKARLHTGYVVQQIDKACKEHGVDISEYGLYCHEEYPEETEEVEVEQADGTKTKERKVIREANEHYSLRYTEVYAVECMYLRRENSRLKEKLASLEERLEKLEQSVK